MLKANLMSEKCKSCKDQQERISSLLQTCMDLTVNNFCLNDGEGALDKINVEEKREEINNHPGLNMGRYKSESRLCITELIKHDVSMTHVAPVILIVLQYLTGKERAKFQVESFIAVDNGTRTSKRSASATELSLSQTSSSDYRNKSSPAANTDFIKGKHKHPSLTDVHINPEVIIDYKKFKKDPVIQTRNMKTKSELLSIGDDIAVELGDNVTGGVEDEQNAEVSAVHSDLKFNEWSKCECTDACEDRDHLCAKSEHDVCYTESKAVPSDCYEFKNDKNNEVTTLLHTEDGYREVPEEEDIHGIGDMCHQNHDDFEVVNPAAVQSLEHISSPQQVACEFCGFLFKKRNLKRHQARHSSLKKFSCDICSKAFKTQGLLSSHKQHHRVNRDWICDVCGHAFNNAANLRQHGKTHSLKRTLACPLCPKMFKSNYVLKDHIMRHSAVKPLSCSVCGHSFRKASELKRHMVAHSDLRPHSCSTCGKTFKTRSNQLKHEKTHSKHSVSKPGIT